MPKSVVNYTPEPVEGEWAQPQVTIHWEDYGVPQISMAIDPKQIEAVLREVAAGRILTDPYGRISFYTEALDRRSLQWLIKAGRRARNAAFGADE
jgi:hypothetical protein